MNDAGSPLFPSGLAPAGHVSASFTGGIPSYRKLIIRGAFLQVVTLGIYRFWLLTDIRRFLWANTQVDGESAEYTGTAMELLLGFLIAIALLVPIFVLIALAGLGLGPAGQAAGAVGYVFLAIFGQYAYFRARRYRLTRTVFRGVRLHQGGSAWRYAFRSVLWWIAIALTLGLAYPFAVASLERYKLSCTFYGDLQGSFAGRGWSLFLRGLLMWLLVLAPAIVSLVLLITAVDWLSIADAIENGGGRDLPRVLESNAAFKTAMGIFSAGIGWLMLAGAVLYPAFQAMVLRWWLNGLRFGDVTVSGHLRTGQVYGAYLRYIGWTLLVMLAAAAIFGSIAGIAVLALKTSSVDNDVGGTLAAVAVFVAYIIVAFCVWIVYQVAVKLRLWRITVDSVEITGFDAVERVHADQSMPSSAVGEGLVDALGAGGM